MRQQDKKKVGKMWSAPTLEFLKENRAVISFVKSGLK